MRVIKFRAWHKENKVVFDVFGFDVNHVMPWRRAFDPVLPIGMCVEECEFMQYTGLKDTTGREVYEGDIIQHHFGTELGQVKYGAYRSCHDTLKTEHWGFYIDFKEDYMRKDIGYWFGIINTAVIGNIYENPDMLEG